mmetsp:Transcript_13850/g.28584  ORF Transcript_13850/g.28584 Transcript_13850/m.28584 type:complete len:397 (+) Transcript_13850:60-1250(+)
MVCFILAQCIFILSICLMRSLVDLGQKLFKDRPWDPGSLEFLAGLAVLEGHDFVVGILFVLGIDFLESQFRVKVLDFNFCRGTHLALSIVLVQKGPLIVVGKLVVGLGKEPSAFLVGNVRSDLAQDFGGGVAVQKVVLGLKVDSHLDQNLTRSVVGGLIRDTRERHGKGNTQIKAVKGRLVLDYKVPALGSQILERQDIAQSVTELPQLGLQSRFQHEIHELELEVCVVSKVSLEDLEDKGLNGDGIVDGNVPGIPDALVPAGFSPAGYGRIHNVVGNQQPGLKPLNGPSQYGQLAELVVGDFVCSQNGNTTFHNHQSAVHLSSLDGVFEHLAKPVGFSFGEFVIGREVCQELLDEQIANLGKGSLGIIHVIVLWIVDACFGLDNANGGRKARGFL